MDEWKNASEYGVWIDGKKVNNDALNQYKAEDFARFTQSRLLGAAKTGRTYNHQVNLTTNSHFEYAYEANIKAQQFRKEHNIQWENRNYILLAK